MTADTGKPVRKPRPRQDPELLRRLLRAKDRMDAASHEEWPVQRLAQVSHVSPAHFARSFKDAFGLPPHRYLLTRRIERAKTLLRDSEQPILDIALQTGWNSLGTFGRTFRDITGESPGELRAREQHACQQPARQQPAHMRHVSEAHAGKQPSRTLLTPQAPTMPPCFAKAAQRPDLTIAVSEKRRRQADATKSPTSEPEDIT